MQEEQKEGIYSPDVTNIIQRFLQDMNDHGVPATVIISKERFTNGYITCHNSLEIDSDLIRHLLEKTVAKDAVKSMDPIVNVQPNVDPTFAKYTFEDIHDYLDAMDYDIQGWSVLINEEQIYESGRWSIHRVQLGKNESFQFYRSFPGQVVPIFNIDYDESIGQDCICAVYSTSATDHPIYKSHKLIKKGTTFNTTNFNWTECIGPAGELARDVLNNIIYQLNHGHRFGETTRPDVKIYRNGRFLDPSSPVYETGDYNSGLGSLRSN